MWVLALLQARGRVQILQEIEQGLLAASVGPGLGWPEGVRASCSGRTPGRPGSFDNLI